MAQSEKTILNFPDYTITKEGQVWSFRKHRFLIPSISKDGYLIVCLSKGSKQHTKLIHQLVLETFIGPCPKGMECRHLNGNPTDARLENLKWGTHRENMEDAKKHGTRQHMRGEIMSRKLTTKDVRMIIYMYATGLFFQKEIAAIYGVVSGTIQAIVTKRTWGHLWT